MFGLFGNKSQSKEEWAVLDSVSQLDGIVQESHEHAVVLFKHSVSCSISAMAKSRLSSSMTEESPKIYYLDLLSYREVSNEIANRFGVRHESPQVIVLKNGQVVYNASHGGINMNDLVSYAA